MSSLESAAGSVLLGKMIAKLEELIKPERIQKVQAVTRPSRSGRTFVDRVSTNNTSIQDDADIEIENPLDAENRITSITIIPDGTMKTDGLLKLQIEDVTVLSIDTAADLTDLNNLPLSIPNEGWEIKPREKIKLFLWTSSGTVSATIIVHFQR